jgi:hypothetical protein
MQIQRIICSDTMKKLWELQSLIINLIDGIVEVKSAPNIATNDLILPLNLGGIYSNYKII